MPIHLPPWNYCGGGLQVYVPVYKIRKNRAKLVVISKIKNPHKYLTYTGLAVVIGLGFEPRTHSLEGCCSIQLSYLTILCLVAQR